MKRLRSYLVVSVFMMMFIRYVWMKWCLKVLSRRMIVVMLVVGLVSRKMSVVLGLIFLVRNVVVIGVFVEVYM